MNKEEPYRDQAERLRQKIEKVNDESKKESGLPSRVAAHRNKKNKTKWKFKFPVIRLLVLFFILLPIVIFSAYSSFVEKGSNSTEKVFSDNGGFEQVAYEQNRNNSDEQEMEDEMNDEATENVKEQQTSSDNEIQVPVDTPPVDENSNESDQEGQLESTDQTKVEPVSKEDKESTVEGKDTVETLYHTVKPNETLFRIAMNYYQSQSGIEIIQQANQLNGNEIKVGQVLKIPK
jgi:LysM repeat protein